MTTSQKLYITLLKRPVGFLGALVGLVVTCPITIPVAVWLFFANKNGLKGIFFTQPRPGKDGRIFRVIKFKSMTDERDADGQLLPDEGRITRVGKFVRKTSIDELPQIINVLKGDMALIGPRPLLVRYLDLYSPEQMRRHEVRPGITGWAQVNGRNNISWTEKFRLDAWYVDHCSLWLDVKIALMTVGNVLAHKNIDGNDEVGCVAFDGTN